MSWLLAVLLAGAHAAPEDALDPFLRRIYDQAREHERDGRLDAAAVAYRTVRQGDPSWTQAVVDLGRVLVEAGREDEALALYRTEPWEADVVEALGRLQLSLDDPDAALKSFERLEHLRASWPMALVLQAAATTDLTAARALLLEYFDFSNATLDEEVVDVTLQIAEASWREEEADEARALLDSLEERFPEVDGHEAVEALRTEFEIDAIARELLQAADQPLEPAQVAILQQARGHFAAGEPESAETILEALVDEHPRSAVAWAALADARLALGDVPGAEQAMGAAVRLAPLEASYVARRAEILSDGFGGRFAEEAERAWARAVRLRPSDPDLWVGKARAERRAGRPATSYERVLALDPDGEHAEEARHAIEAEGRERLPDVVLPEAPGRPRDVPEEAWIAFHRAWAWREHGDPERALEEIATARRAAPRFVRALALEAAIRVDRDELRRAEALYQQALQADETADDTMVDLAHLYGQLGRDDDAEVLWERAAAAGNPRALWRRAVREAGSWRWWSARETLASYFERTTGASSYQEARRLDEQLQARIRGVYGAGGAVVLLGIALPVWARNRRRGGVGIEGLLAVAPDAVRDVARICAALRHEVLKHNTSVLATVADALDDLDPDPAQWAADRLFGPSGALEQLDAYVAELEELGRRAGVRLNLRHRDPTFGPLLAATDQLRGLRTELEHGHGRRLSERLHEVSQALNEDGYQALGRLVAGLQLLELRSDTLRRIYDDVAQEPAFRDAAVPALELADLPEERLLLRLYPRDLRDILANLLRNSIEVSVADGISRLGLAVEVDEDDITGLERVAIRVRDDSPRKLTTQMIRGRYISRGLGLAVDLTSRAGGSIHVETEPGWSKAVVVRLPRAEDR